MFRRRNILIGAVALIVVVIVLGLFIVPRLTNNAQGCSNDRDCDTVVDASDACPDTPGTVANSGCTTMLTQRQCVVTESPRVVLNHGQTMVANNVTYTCQDGTMVTSNTDPNAETNGPTRSTMFDYWEIEYFSGATPEMRSMTFEPAVNNWSITPDQNNPAYNFLSRDGIDWGMQESAYCQQDTTCDVGVASRHYRIITGDYNIPGVDACKAGDNTFGTANVTGCAIMLVNVGEVNAMWRDASVDYGFTHSGVYFNGEAINVTIRATLSNAAYNMMYLKSGVNAGGNCSTWRGCPNVRVAFAITSGNEVLVKGIAQVDRPQE